LKVSSSIHGPGWTLEWREITAVQIGIGNLYHHSPIENIIIVRLHIKKRMMTNTYLTQNMNQSHKYASWGIVTEFTELFLKR
jgi:hypothetical protein